MTAITRVEHPMSLDAPTTWAVRAEARLWEAALLEKVGDADMAETVELLVSYGLNPQDNTVVRLVSSEAPDPSAEDEVVGVGIVNLPMGDNLRYADLSCVVRADRRGQGIGRALWDAMLEVAREHDRSVLSSFTWEPRLDPPGVALVESRTGEGSLNATSREARFMAASGMLLNQVERLSRLELGTAEELARLRDEVRARTTADYECLTVLGPVPDELLPGAAALRVAMSTDSPHGELELEAEAWDADRIRRGEAELELADREQLQTFVRHVATGELVGFTRLFRDRAAERTVHQWETLVVSAHRGHGLGMLCKTTNHAAAAEHWPGIRSVITGNAAENRHMLAINTALGFRPYARVGFWASA